ncbi:MAG: 50S ribosomal protein L21 [Bacteroidetes bacterium]|nr:MAG: 50S ribosomal protein L21 [Bacteroidota bacterium]
MYAIVEIAGKQYKVTENDYLYVARQDAEENEKLSFENVLLVAGGKDIKVGTPLVEGARVEATVIEHVKADKVLVFKKKRRKRYRVTRGHRQPYTRIKIDSVKG